MRSENLYDSGRKSLLKEQAKVGILENAFSFLRARILQAGVSPGTASWVQRRYGRQAENLSQNTTASTCAFSFLCVILVAVLVLLGWRCISYMKRK